MIRVSPSKTFFIDIADKGVYHLSYHAYKSENYIHSDVSCLLQYSPFFILLELGLRIAGSFFVSDTPGQVSANSIGR